MNQTLLGFIRKELTQTLRDRRSWFVLFIAPAFQLVLFGMAISTEMRFIKLGMDNGPGDPLARRLAENSYASGWFIPAPGRDPDPYGWIRSGKADAVLVLPPGGLTRASARGHGQVQLLVNACNVLKCQSVESYARVVLEKTAREEKPPTGPPLLRLTTRVLYNPELRTPVFLVPGVICNIMGILTIILTGVALTREKEAGTFETLIASPALPWEILLGKTIPFILLAMAGAPLILAVAFWGFGVPLRGPLILLFLATLAFVTATVAIGMLISIFCRTQQQSILVGFMFLFPAISLSGLAFPVENMPLYLRLAAYLDPFRYFVEALRNILLKGGDSSVILRDFGALSATALVAALFSFRFFRKTLN